MSSDQQPQAQMQPVLAEVESQVAKIKIGMVEQQQRDEAAAAAQAPKTVEAVKADAKTYDLKDNPFAKYMFTDDPTVTVEQQRDAVAELLTYDQNQSAEDNAARLEQYRLFKESEMYEWRKMQQQIINMIDPKTFSELREMMQQVTEAMAEFDGILNPLQGIIDALQTLRKDPDPDILTKIYQSYAIDAANLKKWEDDKALLRAEVDKKAADLRELNRQKNDYEARKTFFKKFKSEIADLDFRINELATELMGPADSKTGVRPNNGKVKKLADLTDEKSRPAITYTEQSTQFPGKYGVEKAALKVLLDFDAKAWEAKCEELKTKANNQINTIDNRGNSVLNTHRQARLDLNQMIGLETDMRAEFSILHEAEEKARSANTKLYESVKDPAGDEDGMARLKRETTKESVQLYVTEADNNALDTQQVLGELERQNANLNAFRADNIQNVNDAQRLVSSLNAELAAGTTTTIFALFNAATSQARGIAQDAVRNRTAKNNNLIESELDRIAQQPQTVADGILKAADQLQKTAAANKAAAAKAKAGMAAIDRAASLQTDAREAAKEAVGEFSSVAAEQDLANLNAGKGQSGSFNDAAAAPAAPVNDDAAAQVQPTADRLATDGRPRNRFSGRLNNSL